MTVIVRKVSDLEDNQEYTVWYCKSVRLFTAYGKQLKLLQWFDSCSDDIEFSPLVW